MLLQHLLRRRHPKPIFSTLLTTTRFMGGGPRTFPGGLNKWQNKRMHEKLAKEKERKLLHQEKQLYQARLRSEIRARQDNHDKHQQTNSSNYSALSSKDHIKALADRFMRQGAEDLWNEDDGPIRLGERSRLEGRPLNLQKIVNDGRVCLKQLGSFKQKKEYSTSACGFVGEGSNFLSFDKQIVSFVMRKVYLGSRNLGFGNGRDLIRKFVSSDQRMHYGKFRYSSSDDEVEDDIQYSEDGGLIRKDLKILRFSSRIDKKEKGEMGPRFGETTKKMMSGAALKDFDKKKERRAWRDEQYVEESDLMEQVWEMQEDIKNRSNVKVEVMEESVLTHKRFDECNISPLTIRALNSAGYVQMTVVQDVALPACLDGKDVLVKARTGTGKSAAFLLPAIEAVIKASSSNSKQRVPPIIALIICPTREIAIQLAAEGNVLLKHHNGIGIQTLIGGTRFKLDQHRLESNPCQIIVATPGRLLDHIENRSGFSMRLMGLKLLILDEADHLLHLGFRKDIEKIADCIPRQRQSLLFSATIPKEVRRISQVVLNKEHVYLDTVGLGNVETPAKVVQSVIVVPHELHFQMVYHLLKEHITHQLEYKVIVFCTTAMGAAFMHSFLRDLKVNVREMHSRKPQLYRARISDEFRESKNLILITSDVSSRGVHYPDVTLVIQVGTPTDREQYIHRLGRTGREGKDGKGIILLAPWEELFMEELRGLPVEKHQAPNIDSDTKQIVKECIKNIDASIKEAAYHAWLGYYNSISHIGRDKTLLGDLASRFGQSIGLDRAPSLFRKTATKMGLKNVPGIHIRK